jgi:homoserine dehydrogenase
MTPLKIGIAGLGTVGGGLLKLAFGTGPLSRAVEVTAVCARSKSARREVDISGLAWFDDPVALAQSPLIDVFVELIGGSEGPARMAVEAALQAGKHVVTANKALLAAHGASLADLAARTGTEIRYEAAVAGGLPVIKVLREGLAANQIVSVSGVLNGTCNYILTEMEGTGRSFGDVLADAQRLGYAEADPTLDVSGADAGHKLAILSAIAFGGAPRFSDMQLEGIETIEPIDLESARFLGRRVKLLGRATMSESGISQSMRPTLLAQDHPIARVDGALNAVVIEADPVGRLSFVGAGAGAGPTASAVAGDLIDLSHGDVRPVFSGPGAGNGVTTQAPHGTLEAKFYIRLRVADRPGAIAKVTDTLAKHLVSIESFLQKPPEDASRVPIVLTTQICREATVKAALAELAGLEVVVETPVLMPLEG